MTRNKQRLIALALAGVLALQGMPSISYALTSAELKEQADVARAELEALGKQIQAKGEDLHETQYKIESTSQSIEQTKELIEQRRIELEEAQEVLSKRIAANYKNGNIDLISIVLGSSSFEELAGNIYYADKIFESDAASIQSVIDARNELEGEESALEAQLEEQQTLYAQQSEQKKQLEQQEEEQKAYVDGLNKQIVAQIEQERREEAERRRIEAEAAAAAARQAAQEAAQREAEEAARLAAEQAQDGQGGHVDTDGASDGVPFSISPDFDPSAYLELYTNSITESQRQTIIATAWEQVNTPYLLGAMEPGVNFDCSGFVKYCFSQAGIDLPHSAYEQWLVTMSVKPEDLKPGDLVFWIGTGGAATGGNHVAIYLGNNRIIHANYGGVEATDLYEGITGYGTI